MRIWYIQKLLKHLNNNYPSIVNGNQAIWYNAKNKAIALWDNGEIEVLWDILKEGVLKP